jgi:hypothetical protein
MSQPDLIEGHTVDLPAKLLKAIGATGGTKAPFCESVEAGLQPARDAISHDVFGPFDSPTGPDDATANPDCGRSIRVMRDPFRDLRTGDQNGDAGIRAFPLPQKPRIAAWPVPPGDQRDEHENERDDQPAASFPDRFGLRRFHRVAPAARVYGETTDEEHSRLKTKRPSEECYRREIQEAKE